MIAFVMTAVRAEKYNGSPCFRWRIRKRVFRDINDWRSFVVHQKPRLCHVLSFVMKSVLPTHPYDMAVVCGFTLPWDDLVDGRADMRSQGTKTRR